MGRIKDYLMDWEETGEDPLNLIPEHIKAHPPFANLDPPTAIILK